MPRPDRERVNAAKVEGAARRVTDQLAAARRSQPDALAALRAELPELADALDRLAELTDYR